MQIIVKIKLNRGGVEMLVKIFITGFIGLSISNLNIKNLKSSLFQRRIVIMCMMIFTNTLVLGQSDKIVDARQKRNINNNQVITSAVTEQKFSGQDLQIQSNQSSSINEAKDNKSLKVDSNPFTNRIKILNANGVEFYNLMDVTGQTIWVGMQIELQDFSSLKPGLYFLKVNDLNSIKTIKLIKK